MSAKEFASCTWREYILRCRGYDLKRCHEFEHTRIICYVIAKVNSDPKKVFPSIEKFWPLDTDGEQVQSKEEDLNALRIKMVEYYNKTYGKNLS